MLVWFGCNVWITWCMTLVTSISNRSIRTSSPRKLLEFKMQDRGKRTGRRVAKKERTKIRRGITNLFFSSTNDRNRGEKTTPLRSFKTSSIKDGIVVKPFRRRERKKGRTRQRGHQRGSANTASSVGGWSHVDGLEVVVRGGRSSSCHMVRLLRNCVTWIM